MKKIEVIVRPQKFDQLCKAFEDSGVGGITVTDVRGFGHHRNGLKPKIKIEIYADEFQVELIIDMVRRIVSTGATGDGKIAVFEMENVIRIRTGEEGADAI